jgi:dsRNA-specific ribonuclease
MVSFYYCLNYSDFVKCFVSSSLAKNHNIANNKRYAVLGDSYYSYVAMQVNVDSDIDLT